MSIVGPVHARQVEGFRYQATFGKHTITADEPESLGGSDTGMTPLQLMLSALATCIGMTVRLYCEKKKWPAPATLTVDATLERMNAADCAECETKEGPVDVIKRKVVIEGDYDADQLARLHEIAGRCPVHRALTGATEIFSVDEL